MATVSNDLKLRIIQVLLEHVEFRHASDALSGEPPADPEGAYPTTTTIEVVGGEGNTVAVRLGLEASATEAPYVYALTYTVAFEYEGTLPPDFGKRLGITGANMAYPFARELIGNLTSRGRHGAQWLSPMDFGAAIVEAEKLAAEQEQTPESGDSPG